VRTFIGVADRGEGNAAGADADGDTLQQRAEVVSFGWRCWLAHAREALRGRVLSLGMFRAMAFSCNVL
jgi:hypothetical protein